MYEYSLECRTKPWKRDKNNIDNINDIMIKYNINNKNIIKNSNGNSNGNDNNKV